MTCTICRHPDRPAIDRALVAGASFRNVAERFGTSATAAFRHKGDHLPAAMVKAHEAEDIGHAIDVVAQLRAINAATLQVLADARRAGDGDLALRSVDRVQRQLELQAKLIGQLDERAVVNVLVAPEWLSIRAVLLDALGDHPAARQAVAARLQAVEGMRDAG